MELISQGTIFAGTAGTRTAISCFPAVAQLPDGTLLVSWCVAPYKGSVGGRILLSRSADEGLSWSAPEELPAGPWAAKPGDILYAPLTTLGHDHVLAALMWIDRSDPSRPMFNPVTEGLVPVDTWFCESRDCGRSWGDYRVMDGKPHSGPLTITGPVLAFGDKRLACQFEVNKCYEDTQPWRQAAGWKISHDGGRNWPEYVDVAKDPTSRVMFWDARYTVSSNGRAVVAFWTYDRSRQCDMNIHLSESHDGGRTWSAPRDSGLAGQVCYPTLLDGDRLLLTYVDRFHTRSIRAALSNDLGRSFVEEVVVYQHPATQAEQGRESSPAGYLQDMALWAFGRIEAALGIDGTVWLVYYAGTAQATDIHWARLQVSEVQQSIGLHPHLAGVDGRHRAPRRASKMRAIREPM